MKLAKLWRAVREKAPGGFRRDRTALGPIPEETVVLAYRVFLAREPENLDVVGEKTGLSPRDLVSAFLTSPEFLEKIAVPVLETGTSPRWTGPVPRIDDGDVLFGAAGRAGPNLGRAELWTDLFEALLDDPLIADTLAQALDDASVEAFRHRLAEAREGAASLQARQAETLVALGRLTHGLEVQSSRDIIWDAEAGLFHFLSSDPSFQAVIAEDVARDTPVAKLTVRLATPDEGPVGICLYVDDGEGFQERRKLEVWPEAGRAGHFVIVGPADLRAVRLDPADAEVSARIEEVTFAPLHEVEDLLQLVGASDPEAEFRRGIVRRGWLRATEPDPRPEAAAEASRLLTGLVNGMPVEEAIDYPTWISLYETPDDADYGRMAAMQEGFAVKPRFSFVVPAYNTDLPFLQACMESLLAQTYPHFEVCVVDDHSPDPDVSEYLADLASSDSRVRFKRRRTNGHISQASNDAAALATGDWIVLVDHDDTIPDYALFVVADAINRHPEARILFSDEDKITPTGERFDPYFKSDFNEFLMYGHNMVSHLGVYSADLFRQVGGFRRTFEGSQDYDLFFRCYESAGPGAVVHIPHVLYHWRAIPGSTAVSADQKSYAIVAAQGAINGHFERTGRPFRSVDGFAPGITAVAFTRSESTRVSIIIPTRDGVDVLEPCIRSILATGDEQEIIVVDNGSRDPETLAFLEGLVDRSEARVIRHDAPFNFSEINNLGARHATGEILCFLNDDTEIVSPGWLARARVLLSRPEIGVVGARLLYPNGELQHFGVVLGLGKHRVAGHPMVGGRSGEDPGYFGKARLLAEFSAVTGACLFVRRQEFERSGGFDTALRVAFNDVDLCLRLRQRGFKVVCDPEVTLVHKESHSRGSDLEGRRAERLKIEAALMRERWADLLLSDSYWSPNLSLDSGFFVRAVPPRVELPFRRSWRELVDGEPATVG